MMSTSVTHTHNGWSCDGGRGRRRLALIVAATAWLAGITVLDWNDRSSTFLAALLAVGPVFAALALGPWGTAEVLAVALALATVLGVVDGNFGSGQQLADLSAIAFIGLLAIYTALIRVKLGRALQESEETARRDPLTRTLNRGALLEQGNAIAKIRSDTRPTVSVLMIDIDYFKRINDTYGHAIGDEVLAEFAQLLSRHFRGGDVFGRYGGEEFLAIMIGCPSSFAVETATRILSMLRREPIHSSVGELTLSASIGIAGLEDDECDLDLAVKRADHALYESKRSGRGCSTLAEPAHALIGDLDPNRPQKRDQNDTAATR